MLVSQTLCVTIDIILCNMTKTDTSEIKRGLFTVTLIKFAFEMHNLYLKCTSTLSVIIQLSEHLGACMAYNCASVAVPF